MLEQFSDEHLQHLPAELHSIAANMKVYGHRFVGSDVARLPKKDKDAVDEWLVTKKHPLSFEAGTQEGRIHRVLGDHYNTHVKPSQHSEENETAEIPVNHVSDERAEEIVAGSPGMYNPFARKA